MENIKALIGRTGITITPLRASGMIMLDGETYQAETKGGSIPSGKKIKVIGTQLRSWLIVELLSCKE